MSGSTGSGVTPVVPQPLNRSLVARVEIAPEANIPAIVTAAGGDPAYAVYSDGLLTVFGVIQGALEAAVAGTDTLHGKRAELWLKAQQEQDRRLALGLPFRTKLLDLDDRSQVRITAALAAIRLDEFKAGDTISWVTRDNSPLTVGPDDVKIIARMVWRYLRDMHEHFWSLYAQIGAAPDLATLNAINPLAGWPAPPSTEPAA